jgi:hypothetical protein
MEELAVYDYLGRKMVMRKCCLILAAFGLLTALPSVSRAQVPGTVIVTQPTVVVPATTYYYPAPVVARTSYYYYPQPVAPVYSANYYVQPAPVYPSAYVTVAPRVFFPRRPRVYISTPVVGVAY